MYYVKCNNKTEITFSKHSRFSFRPDSIFSSLLSSFSYSIYTKPQYYKSNFDLLIDLCSVLQVRFKNELVLVLVHFTKKRTFRSFLVLWEKVNLVQFKVHQKMN